MSALRRADVELGHGKVVAEACKVLEITEQIRAPSVVDEQYAKLVDARRQTKSRNVIHVKFVVIRALRLGQGAGSIFWRQTDLFRLACKRQEFVPDTLEPALCC